MSADPRVVWMPGGVRTEIHLTGSETDGACCLLVDHPPPGWSLPAHRHRNEAETIYIVEGSFSMEVDGSSSQLSAGDSIHIPRGVIHSGANVGAKIGRRVVMFSPAGLEGFFEEAGGSTPDDIDPADALAIATRHGWDFPSETSERARASRPITARRIARIALIAVAAIVALAILVLTFELVRVIVDPSARA